MAEVVVLSALGSMYTADGSVESRETRSTLKVMAVLEAWTIIGCVGATPIPATRRSRSRLVTANRAFCCASSIPACDARSVELRRNVCTATVMMTIIRIIATSSSMRVNPRRLAGMGMRRRQKEAITVVLRTVSLIAGLETMTVTTM